MSFADFFKPTPAPAQAPAAPQAPTTPPAGNTPPAQLPVGTNQPVNPLDAYTNMYNNANKAPEVAPSYALDSKVLSEVAGGLDFTQGIAPELMQQATQGDSKAMMELIQHVGRQAYQASMSHQARLTDKFVGDRSAYDLKTVGSQVKSELTTSALAQTANYNHPVVKAELKRIASAMQAEHPDQSPQQIAAAATEYFSNLYAAISPATETPAQAAAKADTNWDNFFNTSQ